MRDQRFGNNIPCESSIDRSVPDHCCLCIDPNPISFSLLSHIYVGFLLLSLFPPDVCFSVFFYFIMFALEEPLFPF